MKADLDTYLEREQLEGLLVVGPVAHNPNMAYFTGPADIGEAFLVRALGSEPTLYCFPMERDEATRTGLRTEVLDRNTALKNASGDSFEAEAGLLERVLRENGLTTRVFTCGTVDNGRAIEWFRRLEVRIPSLELVGHEGAKSPVLLARATKDETELVRIRETGRRTVAIVGAMAEFLTSHEVRDGLLVNPDGTPLRVRDVKRQIKVWMAERGLESPKGTIFAIGHDAGVPHSSGQDDQPVPIGQPIVFDIFPSESGGGYFYDFTRTWCLDHAPEAVEQVHQDVLEAYRRAIEGVRPGHECRSLQRATCEFFEARGHPTVLSQPETRNGYVHSLSHGIGLAVHEPPGSSLVQEPPESLVVGHVITIEPGLYYPERGLGVRLEDTLAVGPDGGTVLAPYPTDLVLPMRGKARGQKKSRAQAKKKPKPRPKRSG